MAPPCTSSARAAARTKGSYFGAQYRQIARRRGPNKAAMAVAHSLIELVWHLLSTGEVYKDLGFDKYAIKLALRPDKRFGSDELWDQAESEQHHAVHGRERVVREVEIPIRPPEALTRHG